VVAMAAVAMADTVADMAAEVMPVFRAGMAAITAVAAVAVQWGVTTAAATVAVPWADTMAGEVMAGAGTAQGMAAGTVVEGIPTGTPGGMAVIHIIRIMAAVLGPCRGTGKPAGIPTYRDIWRFLFLRTPILIAARERMAIRL
jgi:hypothetical protein